MRKTTKCIGHDCRGIMDAVPMDPKEFPNAGDHTLFVCRNCSRSCVSPPLEEFPEPSPKALRAAQAIFADLCDRRGIKHEIDQCDEAVLENMVRAHAHLIDLEFQTP